jgi:CBS domain containing-hemolysin-like protein
MKERRIGCVLVEDGGKVVGIFTERDILTKLVGTGYDPAKVAVDGVMTRNPETLTPEDPIAFALQQMSVGGFRHVPLVDSDGHPVGILSVKDIVDYLAEHFPEEILNIPPEPGRQPRIPEGHDTKCRHSAALAFFSCAEAFRIVHSAYTRKEVIQWAYQTGQVR